MPRGGGGQPAPHHPHGTPVRFVAAGGLGAARCQRRQRVVDRNQPRRHGQLALQHGQFVEVVGERGRRGAEGRQFHHLGGDIRIAVAVTADPRSGPQDGSLQQRGIRPARAQRIPDGGVDLRDHLEERRGVVPQAGLDLVGDLQSGQPDQRRLPQGEDLAAQLLFDGAAVLGLLAAVQAQPHQPGDPVLGVEHRAPAGLGRVRGDDR